MNQKGNRSGARRRGSKFGGQERRGRGGPRGPRKPAGPPVEPLHPTENPPDVEHFDEFELNDTVQQAIAEMGIVKPTPIQALAIEPVLKGRDVIAKAETGTGKTLAFGAPMISKIDADRVTVLGLCLCPTRELAEQVADVLEKLGEPRDIKVALIVGGEPAGPQVAALHAGAQVVVGTPGRVIDLYEQKFLSFPWTEFVVLDEADEMLEIGFIDDVKKILNFTPEERQTLLFSATFPDTLLRLARDYTRDPAEIATASGVKTVDNITQQYVALDDSERPLALIRMIERSEPEDVFLVFCERRTDVERLMRRLERLSFSIKALHGGYDQAARFRVMGAFRTGEVKVLVATDVASRGLDVKHVTRVVNYSVPRSITDYTHRIGRTGRAGREGHAVTLVTHEHMHRWKMLLREASWEIEHVEAPGSRFENSRRARPERQPRQEESRGRREDQDEPRSERSRRPQREESKRSRDTRSGDRNRDERSESRNRRERGGSQRGSQSDEDSRRATESPSPVRQRASDNEPVTLPSGRPRRQRDPNDPPRRTRRRRTEAGDQEERSSRGDSSRDEGRDSRSSGRSREERSSRTRDKAREERESSPRPLPEETPGNSEHQAEETSRDTSNRPSRRPKRQRDSEQSPDRSSSVPERLPRNQEPRVEERTSTNPEAPRGGFGMGL